MRRQLIPSVTMVLVFTVLTGFVYPLVVTGVAQALFHDQANGSIVERDGQPVGSGRIGQPFEERRYFHPRPSAAGEGYDGAASSGSNKGPTNDEFLATVDGRAAAYRRLNGLRPNAAVPVDAVTASGSGLDPHISLANARRQAARVAKARRLTVGRVLDLVGQYTEGRSLGFLGEPGVNVLRLNLALDELER